jgi:hypothetical protein
MPEYDHEAETCETLIPWTLATQHGRKRKDGTPSNMGTRKIGATSDERILEETRENAINALPAFLNAGGHLRAVESSTSEEIQPVVVDGLFPRKSIEALMDDSSMSSEDWIT